MVCKISIFFYLQQIFGLIITEDEVQHNKCSICFVLFKYLQGKLDIIIKALWNKLDTKRRQ